LQEQFTRTQERLSAVRTGAADVAAMLKPAYLPGQVRRRAGHGLHSQIPARRRPRHVLLAGPELGAVLRRVRPGNAHSHAGL